MLKVSKWPIKYYTFQFALHLIWYSLSPCLPALFSSYLPSFQFSPLSLLNSSTSKTLQHYHVVSLGPLTSLSFSLPSKKKIKKYPQHSPRRFDSIRAQTLFLFQFSPSFFFVFLEHFRFNLVLLWPSTSQLQL